MLFVTLIILFTLLVLFRRQTSNVLLGLLGAWIAYLIPDMMIRYVLRVPLMYDADIGTAALTSVQSVPTYLQSRLSWVIGGFVVGVLIGILVKPKPNRSYKTSYKRRPTQTRSHLPRLDVDTVKPKIYWFNSDEHFNREVQNASTTLPINTATIAPIANDRVRGAVMVLTKQNYLQHKQLIKVGAISRDDQKRQRAQVPGFSHEFVDTPSGRQYLYHRTHLLPFRFAMSEGDDAPGLLFTGTSHLNSGGRPRMGYKKPEGFDRVNFLYNWYRKRGWVKLTGQAINVKNAPEGTHYSLDDVEQLASKIIQEETNPKNVFKYAIYCYYNEDNTGVIPSGVVATLYDVTRNTTRIRAVLPNAM